MLMPKPSVALKDAKAKEETPEMDLRDDTKIKLQKAGDTFRGDLTLGRNKIGITLSMKGEKLTMDVELKNQDGTAKDTYILKIRKVEGGLLAEDLQGEWKLKETPGMRPHIWEIMRTDPYYIFNGVSPGHGLLDNKELANWIRGHLEESEEKAKSFKEHQER
jgi:hypothetical protein